MRNNTVGSLLLFMIHVQGSLLADSPARLLKPQHQVAKSVKNSKNKEEKTTTSWRKKAAYTAVTLAVIAGTVYCLKPRSGSGSGSSAGCGGANIAHPEDPRSVVNQNLSRVSSTPSLSRLSTGGAIASVVPSWTEKPPTVETLADLLQRETEDGKANLHNSDITGAYRKYGERKGQAVIGVSGITENASQVASCKVINLEDRKLCKASDYYTFSSKIYTPYIVDIDNIRYNAVRCNKRGDVLWHALKNTHLSLYLSPGFIKGQRCNVVSGAVLTEVPLVEFSTPEKEGKYPLYPHCTLGQDGSWYLGAVQRSEDGETLIPVALDILLLRNHA